MANKGKQSSISLLILLCARQNSHPDLDQTQEGAWRFHAEPDCGAQLGAKFQADPQSSCLDRPRSGGPRTARNNRVICQIQRIVQDNAHVTLRDLALQARVSVGSIHSILRKDLQMQKIAARFVPKLLTAEQRQKRVDTCRENLDHLQTEPLLLWHVISGDESWCYTYDPVRKHQSEVWVGPGDCRPQKALHSRS